MKLMYSELVVYEYSILARDGCKPVEVKLMRQQYARIMLWLAAVWNRSTLSDSVAYESFTILQAAC